MGCTPSKRGHDDRSPEGSREFRDLEADRIEAMVLVPNPQITVTIGNGVATEPDFMHTVIFVFGGPGSQKGVLTQELAHEFDFTLINVEDIVFSYLPNKVANTVSSIVEIQELLRRDSGVLTLEWILSMISAKLSTSTNQRFIIDIVPELTSILKSETYRIGDIDKKLEHFENRHHIFCAMELFVSGEEELYEAKQDGSEPIKNELDTKELSPELTAFVRGIDEADKGRLEKRITNYHKCAKPFLKYFSRTKRVVKFDLKRPHNPEILNAVRKTLTDFGFARNNDFIRVVLFVMKDKQTVDIDLDYYRLRKVYLSEICYDKEETLSQQIRAVRKFIYRTTQQNENFLIVLNCLNNTDYPLTKRINFLENKHTYLDYFIRNRETRVPAQRCKMGFRSISTTTGELCLFPQSMDEHVCNKIGYIFGEKLTLTTVRQNEVNGNTSVDSNKKVEKRVLTPHTPRSALPLSNNFLSAAPWTPISPVVVERPRSSSMTIKKSIENSTENQRSGSRHHHKGHGEKSKSDQNLSKNQKSPKITLTTHFGSSSYAKRQTTIAPQPTI